MKLLIVLTTGRSTTSLIVAALGESFKTNFRGDCSVSLLVNYDPTFETLHPDAFLLSGELERQFDRVMYVGPESLAYACRELVRSGLSFLEASTLLQARGYGCRKNLALLIAVQERYDAVLFWDDDEYPLVWAGARDWYATDILGSHLTALKQGADVTFGFWSGFVSPIPSDLSTVLSSEVLASLGEALSLATESFRPNSFLEPYRSLVSIESPPKEIEIRSTRGGKWVSGGNLGIRVASVIDGKVPPFYTPPGSRGDDTILSLRLHAAVVRRVAAGIFHDCFGLYSEALFRGTLPPVAPVSFSNSNVRKRLAAALTAWLAYSPLFLVLSEPAAFNENRALIRKSLAVVDRGLEAKCTALLQGVPSRSLVATFDRYLSELQMRQKDLLRVDRIFPQLLTISAKGPIWFYENTPGTKPLRRRRQPRRLSLRGNFPLV